MHAFRHRTTAVATHTGPGWAWEAPTEAVAAILELTASEHPELLEFQAHALLNSTMGFALRKLAAAIDVAPEKVGAAIGRACADLDLLERQRKVRWEPGQVLDDPNLAALLYLCSARLKRVGEGRRRFRLERVLRRVEPAYEVARARAWIDDFIGPLPAKRKGVRADVR